jgi:hypothetical protein
MSELPFPIVDDGLRNILTALRARSEVRMWAGIGQPGQTVDDLAAKMEQIGNQVLEIDYENERVLCLHRGGIEQDQWGCRLCLINSDITIVDTEEELLNHCEDAHPDWRSL